MNSNQIVPTVGTIVLYKAAEISATPLAAIITEVQAEANTVSLTIFTKGATPFTIENVVQGDQDRQFSFVAPIVTAGAGGAGGAGGTDINTEVGGGAGTGGETAAA